jgi:hypothetical protein
MFAKKELEQDEPFVAPSFKFEENNGEKFVGILRGESGKEFEMFRIEGRKILNFIFGYRWRQKREGKVRKKKGI